jgi:threonylcarbamoyladenosine tRNA methylthiotransferase MtaB
VKKKRSEKMLNLAKTSLQNFQKDYIGRKRIVLYEISHGGVWSGLTDNYIKVYTKNSGDLFNQLLPTTLLELQGEGMTGELAE